MDPFPIIRRMEEDIRSDVSVTDVYDQAAAIGKEFKKLIETFGVDAVTDLMPKVIRALEQLEGLADRYEKECNEISDLRFAVEKLEAEKSEKLQERSRFEEELIQIEESWQKESKEHLSLIGRLQDDNRRLKLALTEQTQTVVEEVAAVAKKTEDKEIELLTKLKDTVDGQREEIRKYHKEIQQKNVDIEAMQAHNERLVKINLELRRKNLSHRRHAKTLLSDKVDLEIQLAEKEQNVTSIKDRLNAQESIDDSSMEVQRQVGSADVNMQTDVSKEDVQIDEEKHENLMEKLSLIGKIIIDKQDPDKPRFTLNELRTLLMERNELKSKLIEVQEELESIRPKDIDSNTNAIVEVNSQEDLSSCGEVEDEEFPVQGPINKEPYEKLYGKKPSGIRRFFEDIIEKFSLHLDFDF